VIRKAVIPAAGFGTRFLPATKSQPKEMLPIVDTPVIQYVVEEAVAAGITDILMVIGKGKRAIEEHFDRDFQLESQLERGGKTPELELVRRISDLADIHFIWQKEQLGLGDAVRCARHHVGDEPFAVLLGDTLIRSKGHATTQLIRVFDRFREPVVLLEKVPPEKAPLYGIVEGKNIDDGLILIKRLIEKPTVEEAPSDLAIASRYVFTPEIFAHLERVQPGKGGEIQLTDAMQLMLADRAMYGLELVGKRYDIGNKVGFLKTNIEFALQREDTAAELRSYLKGLEDSL